MTCVKQANYSGNVQRAIRSLVVAATLTLSGCGREQAVSLEVKLRTDYQPIREFVSAEIIVDADSRQRIANVDGQYVLPGESLATFNELTPTSRRGITVKSHSFGRRHANFVHRSDRTYKGPGTDGRHYARL